MQILHKAAICEADWKMESAISQLDSRRDSVVSLVGLFAC